jgi:MoaA/NifB/PqqE/SkfB family radical SAM enzyme
VKEIYSNDKDAFLLTWQFTSMCNFACAYCPEGLHDNTVKFPNYDLTLAFIKEIAKNNKKVYINLLGGEPTLWPELINFLKETKKISNIITILETNGSRSTRWWEEFSKAELDLNVILDFTYHAALCDPDLYYDNLKTIHETHQVNSSFMLDPFHFDKTNKLYKKIKDNLAVDCFYKTIRKGNMSSLDTYFDYTPEMLSKLELSRAEMLYDRNKFSVKKSSTIDNAPSELFVDGKRTNWQTFVLEKKHNFKNWKCSAGVKRLYIELNGDIWPCSVIGGGSYGKLNHKIGNIYDGTFKGKTEYMNCPVNYCGCKMDAILHKENISWESYKKNKQ